MRATLTAGVCALMVVCGAAQAHSSSFKAILNGGNEVNGGDADGAGIALITIDYDTNVLSYDITFSGLGTLAAAHIHSGAAGVNGPVSIGFKVPEGLIGSGHFTGTVAGNPNSLFVTELTASSFYVNLHTDEFAGGAIRGQLAASVPEPQSVVLLLAGLGVVGWAAARRRAA